MEWQVMIDATGRAGASNMALDALLLEDAARTGRATLRLYRWSPPCLSFGRNEPALARYDRAAIEHRGWDVVRRPTGGRAVWHEDEVTYAVAAPIAAFGSLHQSYCAIHERLAAALRTLGAPARLAPKNGRPAGLGVGACFASPVGGEITVHDRKVVGSAQVRLESAFLQHGSIPWRSDPSILRPFATSSHAPMSSKHAGVVSRFRPRRGSTAVAATPSRANPRCSASAIVL